MSLYRSGQLRDIFIKKIEPLQTNIILDQTIPLNKIVCNLKYQRFTTLQRYVIRNIEFVAITKFFSML